jgi:hypothetical protein
VISKDYLCSQHHGGYVLLTVNATKLTPHSSTEYVGKSIKYNFAFCAAEYVGEKTTFDSVLNLKYFI